MRLGFNLNLWTREVTQDHLPILTALAQAGYDGVEVPVMAGTGFNAQIVGGMIEDLGLACTALTVLPGPDASCLGDDPSCHRAALDHIKWAIDQSSDIGAELLCGPFFQQIFEIPGTPASPSELDRIAEIHGLAADHAARRGLKLSVEPLNRFECHALTTCAQARALVKAVGRSNYGFLYDTFHANIEETDPVDALAANLDGINHVHLSENDRGAPGRGHVPWQETLKVLKDNDFQGWCVIESFGRLPAQTGPKNRVYRQICDSDATIYHEGATFLRRCWASL